MSTYATSDEDRCYHEECWLLLGHDGLHAYHPAMTTPTPAAPSRRAEVNGAGE